MATPTKPSCDYCGAEHLSLNPKYNELVVVQKVVIDNETRHICQRCLDHRTPQRSSTQKKPADKTVKLSGYTGL